jgi:hypothetical protein
MFFGGPGATAHIADHQSDKTVIRRVVCLFRMEESISIFVISLSEL